MKPTINRRIAFTIGYMKGTSEACAVCFIPVLLAWLLSPSKITWQIPVFVACLGIAARIGHSILVDEAMAAHKKERAKLFNLDE